MLTQERIEEIKAQLEGLSKEEQQQKFQEILQSLWLACAISPRTEKRTINLL